MRMILLCLLPLSACLGVKTTRLYAGPQRPLAGTCDPASRATLSIRGNAMVFAPQDGTTTLQGTVEGTALSASAVFPGADRKSYRLQLTGQLAGDQIDATLVTPRCRYALTLTRTSH